MDYADNKGMNFKVDPCDTNPANKTLHGFKIDEACRCNSCQQSCTYNSNTTMAVMNGFSWLTVGIVYLIVILATVLIYLIKRHYRNKKSDDRSRSSSMSSYELPLSNTGSRNTLTMNNINSLQNKTGDKLL